MRFLYHSAENFTTEFMKYLLSKKIYSSHHPWVSRTWRTCCCRKWWLWFGTGWFFYEIDWLTWLCLWILSQAEKIITIENIFTQKQSILSEKVVIVVSFWLSTQNLSQVSQTFHRKTCLQYTEGPLESCNHLLRYYTLNCSRKFSVKDCMIDVMGRIWLQGAPFVRAEVKTLEPQKRPPNTSH